MPDRLSPDEIAALRARTNRMEWLWPAEVKPLLDAAEARAVQWQTMLNLQAERDRLDEDNVRLVARIATLMHEKGELTAERDRLEERFEITLAQNGDLKADKARLTAERDRLAAALRKTRDIIAALQHMDTKDLVASIDAALEGTP